MPKCFLSQSDGYGHLKEPFRRLLEALGFDHPVQVFDGGDMHAVPDIVIERIQEADAVVVLYGPRHPPTNKRKPQNGADWPREEAVLARGMQKPILLIVHENTTLPVSLSGHQTPARFDFWDDRSFLNNIHHIVAHISGFRQRMTTAAEVSRRSASFRVKKATMRTIIHSAESETLEVYHEVTASKSCGVFQHAIDAGRDETLVLPAPENIQYKLQKRVGPARCNISLRFGRCRPSDVEYFIDVTPGLQPGDELGYWRSFELPNTFPLTPEELVGRASKTGFPTEFDAGFYGTPWDVVYDMDHLTRSIHFPAHVKLGRCDAKVFHYMTRELNIEETQRCGPLVRLTEDTHGPIVQMVIPHPLINHSYCLCYEPKES